MYHCGVDYAAVLQVMREPVVVPRFMVIVANDVKYAFPG